MDAVFEGLVHSAALATAIRNLIQGEKEKEKEMALKVLQIVGTLQVVEGLASTLHR